MAGHAVAPAVPAFTASAVAAIDKAGSDGSNRVARFRAPARAEQAEAASGAAFAIHLHAAPRGLPPAFSPSAFAAQVLAFEGEQSGASLEAASAAYRKATPDGAPRPGAVEVLPPLPRLDSGRAFDLMV